MHIKQQTIIPAHVKVTKFAPSKAKVPNLFTLERRHERKLERQSNAKEYQQRYQEALSKGMSVGEAAVYAMAL